MDNKQHQVASCDMLSTAAREPQSNHQMSTVKVKEEIDCSFEYSSAETEYVNDYDSKCNSLEQVKKEFPEDECPQSDTSMSSKTHSENKELLKVINKEDIKRENTEEELLISIKEENDVNKYQFIVKSERLEAQDVLYNDGETKHYDVLVTPEEFQCKVCDRTFHSSIDLLNHNKEHVKVEIDIPGDNKLVELHNCQYCDKHFDCHDNMLTHISDVHSETKPKCELCGKEFKNVKNLKRHMRAVHKIKSPPKTAQSNSNVDGKHKANSRKSDEEMRYKCDSCDGVYTNRYNLSLHMKRVHYSYDKSFECSCGKQFRSPIHLSEHKRRQHDNENSNNDKFQCDYCKKLFKTKQNLVIHIKRTHYDYGRLFICWCGVRFSSPIHLRTHKWRRHDPKRGDILQPKYSVQ